MNRWTRDWITLGLFVAAGLVVLAVGEFIVHVAGLIWVTGL